MYIYIYIYFIYIIANCNDGCSSFELLCSVLVQHYGISITNY